MSLIRHVSEVAGVHFSSLQEAGEYYIRDSFRETIESPDLEFVFCYGELAGKEPNRSQATKAFELLEELPERFNNSREDMVSRILCAKAFFISSVEFSNIPDSKSRISKIVETLSIKAQDVVMAEDYLINKVLTPNAVQAIYTYFRNGDVLFSILEGTEKSRLSRGMFIAWACTLTGSILRREEAVFNASQMEYILDYVNSYSNDKVELLYSDYMNLEDIKSSFLTLNKAMKVEDFSGRGVIPIGKVYYNLRQSLSRRDLGSTVGLCSLMSIYRRYALLKELTIK